MGSHKDKYYKQSRYTYSGKQERAIASSTSAYQTRLITNEYENAVLELIGSYLFSHTLDDWAECKAGKSTAERKQRMCRYIGDRYAYSIVQRNNEQLALQKRNIKQDRKLRERENKAFEKRIEQARKWQAEHPDLLTVSGDKPSKKKYHPLTYEEWGRYQHNQAILAKYDSGRYIGVTFGGKSKQRVAVRAIQRDPDSEEAQSKHREWKLSRYQIRAIGDSTHACGNSVVRIDDTGSIRILVPEEIRGDAQEKLGQPLASGKYLILENPAVFEYGWNVLLENIQANKSVTSSITYSNGFWRITSTANSSSAVNTTTSDAASDGGSISSDKDKRQTFASGKSNPAVIARKAVEEATKNLKKSTVSSLLERSETCGKKNKLRFLGIDINDGHIDAVVCDVHGNPCGKALTIPFRNTGTSKQIKSSVLHALDRIRHIAEKRHVSCVFIEALAGFLDSKSKALNDGGRAFRRAVHRIPCGEFREWSVRKLTFGDCHVELVPAAYTSKRGAEFWGDLFASSHQAAALMIARRGLGLGLFRRTSSSPCHSCATGRESSMTSREDACSGAIGGSARVRSDHREKTASVVSDIDGAPTSKGALSWTFRRSCCLRSPAGDQVPR